MIRLGFWIVLGALACMAVTFLPAVMGDSSDLEFAANALLCDGDRAVLSINLSEAALAKSNLASVVSGFCTDAAGRLITNIPIKRVSDLLTAALITALVGIVIIGIGLVRRPKRLVVMTASPVQSDSGARARKRDAEDVKAHRDAARRRAQTPTPVAATAASGTPIPDWMAGMPAAELQPHQTSSPALRFDFGDSPAQTPQTDLQIQLNLLQLAYESSLIMRSEYDARRAALLRSANQS